ncbi:uncharacterized protein PAC_05392 [Phialocephala subalpina]|uniref:Tat pathway signal sequence n=1 Tax=Phialocephala subalpina TaxID=576137 RepID=A0A1L7WRU2_9HELO|nr:uncharacterized protein PAC_05392 [Phialocephala subalpina]
MPSHWLSTMISLTRWRKQKKYTPVTDYRDDSSVDGEKGELLPQERGSLSITSDDGILPVRKSPQNVLHKLSIGLNIALICAIMALVAIAWPELVLRWDKFGNGLLKRTSRPSPILNQAHIPLITSKRNGSLLPHNPPSIFRQDPSDEVDMAWARIGNINPIPMSAAEVRGNGYDPSIVARWPEVYGLGPDAYVGRLDVFHEIHCLDMLRREAHYDYYYEKEWPKAAGGAPADHRVHVSHCVYALLQELMCNANTDPFVHYWVDIGDEPYPDFSITRQCRDFEAVLEWQEEKSIPMSQYRDVIRKPLGVTPKIMSDEYKYMVGLINEDGSPKVHAEEKSGG